MTADWRIDEQQLGELNAVLQRQDDVLVYNCVTRTAQESKLFPVLPYLMNVMVETYYRYPDIIREASQHVTPEEVGHRSREVSTYLSGLTGWATLNYYLNGRAWLIRMGFIRPEDNLEDLWTVTDWWLRFQRSYRRSNGHVNAIDGWDTNAVHPERTLQVFEADAYRLDDRLRTATTKFLATATQYSFLINCESRSGLQSTGPYRIGGGRLMHTRDFFNLAECDLSWLDGVATDVTFNNLTMVLITDDVRVEITDWGTAYTTPEQISGKISGVGLYQSDYLSDRYLPVGMGSAAELAETLDELTAQCAAATRTLYSRYAEMSFTQMVEAGVYTYLSAANGISHAAGTYDQAQWEFIDDRTRRFWPIMNEEYALDAYLENFNLLQGRHGSASEYFMDSVPYRSWRAGNGTDLPGPGRNAFPVSQHVLRDHDYSLRVNPKGTASFSGTSSLPAKSTLFSTTRGKLTQDQANAAARELHSPLYEAPWVSMDDEWVKWHWQDADVDALYRHTQQGSRLLEGRGAGLRRTDLDAIRTAAGEPAWGVQA